MFSKPLMSASAKPAVLAILAHGEAYGYQLIQRMKHLSGGQLAWTPGTLYPLLHRLETEGLIASEWRQPSGERRRKYYRLTPLGEAQRAHEKQQWMQMHAVLLTLWQPNLSFDT